MPLHEPFSTPARRLDIASRVCLWGFFQQLGFEGLPFWTQARACTNRQSPRQYANTLLRKFVGDEDFSELEANSLWLLDLQAECGIWTPIVWIFQFEDWKTQEEGSQARYSAGSGTRSAFWRALLLWGRGAKSYQNAKIAISRRGSRVAWWKVECSEGWCFKSVFDDSQTRLTSQTSSLQIFPGSLGSMTTCLEQLKDLSTTTSLAGLPRACQIARWQSRINAWHAIKPDWAQQMSSLIEAHFEEAQGSEQLLYRHLESPHNLLKTHKQFASPPFGSWPTPEYSLLWLHPAKQAASEAKKAAKKVHELGNQIMAVARQENVRNIAAAVDCFGEASEMEEIFQESFDALQRQLQQAFESMSEDVDKFVKGVLESPASTTRFGFTKLRALAKQLEESTSAWENAEGVASQTRASLAGWHQHLKAAMTGWLNDLLERSREILKNVGQLAFGSEYQDARSFLVCNWKRSQFWANT